MFNKENPHLNNIRLGKYKIQFLHQTASAFLVYLGEAHQLLYFHGEPRSALRVGRIEKKQRGNSGFEGDKRETKMA